MGCLYRPEQEDRQSPPQTHRREFWQVLRSSTEPMQHRLRDQIGSSNSPKSNRGPFASSALRMTARGLRHLPEWATKVAHPNFANRAKRALTPLTPLRYFFSSTSTYSASITPSSFFLSCSGACGAGVSPCDSACALYMISASLWLAVVSFS